MKKRNQRRTSKIHDVVHGFTEVVDISYSMVQPPQAVGNLGGVCNMLVSS